MEYQRRPSTISCTHSFSDTDLDTAGTGFEESQYYLDDNCDSSNHRFSTPLILISPGTSVNNSTSSIPSSLAATATSSTQTSADSPPLLYSPNNGKDDSQPRNFTLDLNSSDATDGNDQATPPDDFLPLDATSLDRGRRYPTREGYQSRYENKSSLAHDLVSLSTMPEFCDVTFLVGEGRQPVCGVKAILAARSRVFRKMLYMDSNAVIGGKKGKKKQNFRPTDSYIEKFDFRGQPTIIVRDFDPQVFKLLIDYTHTGSVMLQSSTLLGLMNAADHYGLEDLKQACSRFIEKCISKDTVCVMLTSAEKYIQYKSTKSLIKKIFEYVDVHAEAILAMEDFVNLPQHIVRIVLGREELRASEAAKFDAAYQWCLRYCRTYPEVDIKATFEPFVDVINYNNIPARHLMQRVKKAGVVDDARILSALAHQADPSFIAGKANPNSRPLSAAPSASALYSVSPKLQKTPTDSAIRTRHQEAPASTTSGKFRRVQSSGTRVDFGVNTASSSAPDQEGKDTRASSVPLSPADEENHSSDMVSVDGLYLPGSEVHPLQVHDPRDHHSSGSSSHLSILSTPPLSPAQSLLSTGSHQGSLLSVSSGDSIVHSNGLTSNPERPSSLSSKGRLTTSTSQGNLKKHSYNPQALDAIVKIGIGSSSKR